jgi:hypothetical protein
LAKFVQSFSIERRFFMKKKISFPAATIALLAFCFPLAGQTMPRGTGLSASASPIASALPTASASPSKQSPRPLPFHGMVSAVDQKNKTFTISGKGATRVFKLTDKTVVMKGAGNAKFADIAENQEVSGAFWKNADGSLEAKLVKLGPTEKTNASPAVKASTSPSSSPTPSS